MKYLLMQCFFCCVVAMSYAGTADSVRVDAHEEGDHVVLSVHFSVPVSQDVAWGVMTDFEHMAQFMPHLKESKVLSHSYNNYRVEQKGVVHIALFDVDFSSVRDLVLVPNSEIQSSTVGGNAGLTRSVSRLLRNGLMQTEVDYRADWWPSSQLLAGFGMDSIRDLLSKQFNAMRQEMLRRQLVLKSGEVSPRAVR